MTSSNRLAGSSSPYLRQHQYDPVDWYPFGDEAMARAKELDRPLFLSIGYSACHWCHVMGHESFADETTAREMNETVVAVKVDREERPDVDAIYMEAVQAATGSGGWPLSVFATPDGRPFFAGTYFPDRPRHGSPAFRQVLAAVAEVWSNRRADVEQQADALADAVARRIAPPPPLVVPEDRAVTAGGARAATAPEGAAPMNGAEVAAAVRAAVARLVEIADPELGGFGRAPKFPQPLLLDVLLRAHAEGATAATERGALEVALDALEAMAVGGIWDQVGGGFARYSVDREWLVPHFEKMLYDQALLGRVYLHAFQLTGDGRWLAVLDELVAYVLRDLRLPSSLLASAEDADSEGEEGRFYTWEAAEIDAVLGPELAPVARRYWSVTDQGNFEGRNILWRGPLASVRAGQRSGELPPLPRPPEIERARTALAGARAGRVRPGLDDKALTEWNAMMCATLAEAGLAIGREEWVAAAGEIASVLLSSSRLGSGRVLRTPAREGEAPILGYATDLAWLVAACVRLAEATGEARWLSPAMEVADQLLELFTDAETGGLYTTGSDAAPLVVRPRELYDNVTPAASSVAGVALVRLAALVGEARYDDAASRLVAAGSAVLSSSPTAVPELLHAAGLVAAGTVEVAVTGGRRDLVRAAARRGDPRIVIAWSASGEASVHAPGEGGAGGPPGVPLLEVRPAGLAYVCRFGECRLPVASAAELAGEIQAALEAASL